VGGKLQVCTQVNGSYFGYKKLVAGSQYLLGPEIKLILWSVMFMVYLFGLQLATRGHCCNFVSCFMHANAMRGREREEARVDRGRG